ncbi:MAG: hypothetical protein AAB638_03615, partial [Patescibacteria group bacterium]
MSQSGRMPSGAMFDVKPVDDSGALDFQKIDAVKPIVNLTSFRPKKVFGRKTSQPAQRSASVPAPSEMALPEVIKLPSQQDIKEEFEELLNHDLDLGIELAKIGTQPKLESSGKPRYRVIQSSFSAHEASRLDPIVLAVQQSARASIHRNYSEDVEAEPTLVSAPTLLSVGPVQLSPSAQLNVVEFFAPPQVNLISKHLKSKSSRGPRIINKRYVWFAVVIIIFAGLLIGYGWHVKNKVVEQSAAAVTSLQSAQVDLKTLDFKNAAQDFFSAYSSFSQA